ncbi:hypothetical protein JI435_306720, partial [Parastagonospora nodorum SN15]
RILVPRSSPTPNHHVSMPCSGCVFGLNIVLFSGKHAYTVPPRPSEEQKLQSKASSSQVWSPLGQKHSLSTWHLSCGISLPSTKFDQEKHISMDTNLT